MRRSGQESTNQMWQAVGNVNWMARSMDLSQKSNQKAMADQVRKLQSVVDQTAKLAEDADTANGIAHEALATQTRPWLGIEGSEAVVDEKNTSQTSTGFELTFSINLHNYGHSPALGEGYSAPPTAIGSRDMPPPAYIEESKICDALEQDSRKPLAEQVFGDVIWPVKDQNIKIRTSVPRSGGWVPGCISYEDIEGLIHHTYFMYQVTTNYRELVLTGPDFDQQALKIRGVSLVRIAPR
jgi:hypothetical protein